MMADQGEDGWYNINFPGRKASDVLLNIMEWDDFFTKKKKKKTGTDTGDSATLTAATTTTTGGNITSGGGPTAAIMPAPAYQTTPSVGTVTPIYSDPLTGRSTKTLDSFTPGIQKQEEAFATRDTASALLPQAQTLEELNKIETGGGPKAPKFENKLYRNRFGMTVYIQFIDGNPTTPIPQGYYEVKEFTTDTPAAGENQGGVIQGYQPGGFVTQEEYDTAANFLTSGNRFGNQAQAFLNNPTGYGGTTKFGNRQITLGAYNLEDYDYIPAGVSDTLTKLQAGATISNSSGTSGTSGNSDTSVVFENSTVNPPLNFKPGGKIVNRSGGQFAIEYLDGTFSQNYPDALSVNQALNEANKTLGFPNYTEYLTSIGVDPNLPGYDLDLYSQSYKDYISNPATLTEINRQKLLNEQKIAQESQKTNINQESPTEVQEITAEDLANYQRNLLAQTYAAPAGAVAAPPTSYIDPNAYGTVLPSTTGQALVSAPIIQDDQAAQLTNAEVADVPTKIGASQVTPSTSFSDIQNLITSDEGKSLAAAQSDGPTKTITAASQEGSNVNTLTAADGKAKKVKGAPTRTLDTTEGQSELIKGTGISAENQTSIDTAFGTGQVQAASVADELASLMKGFEGGNTPLWAKGAIAKASAIMSARGLSASSMAGQAIIETAMQAALPIAQIDAGNKQQVALFNAEQRARFLNLEFDQAFQAKVMNAAKISEIANINFNAEQQIALENSRAANTMALTNLNNEQALVMAEAAALSQIDLANLSNSQQAAVQNAQNFLQIDMANLANEQQSALLKHQSLINSIFSDTAAANAGEQFNATSENQTNQFFANLGSSVNQFNAAQINAMNQFNADEVNSVLEFNATLQDLRERFNAQQYLVIAQANAKWRQDLNTLNTATANESNMDFAQTVNALTVKSLDEIWQRERDIMDYAFTQGENGADRAMNLLLGDKKLEAIREELEANEQRALGGLLTKVFFGNVFQQKDFTGLLGASLFGA
jgi:hypothetical protein